METQTPIEVEPPQQKKPEPSGLRVLILVLGGIFGMAMEVATGLLIASVYWGAQIGTWQHKSLVAQACLRGAIVAFLVSSYIRLRKGQGGPLNSQR